MTVLITLAEGVEAWISQTPTSSAFSSSDVLFSQRSSCTLLILCVLSGLSSAMWTINTAHCSPANGVAEGQGGKSSSSSERQLEKGPRKGLCLTLLEDPWHHDDKVPRITEQLFLGDGILPGNHDDRKDFFFFFFFLELWGKERLVPISHQR